MTDESETIEIEVSDESTALEVGYGVLGRAQQIHDNPTDKHEDTAIELEDVAREIIEEYEDEDMSGTGDTEQCKLCETTTETWDEMLTHLESEHPELWEGDADKTDLTISDTKLAHDDLVEQAEKVLIAVEKTSYHPRAYEEAEQLQEMIEERGDTDLYPEEEGGDVPDFPSDTGSEGCIDEIIGQTIKDVKYNGGDGSPFALVLDDERLVFLDEPDSGHTDTDN